MELIEHLSLGFQVAFTAQNLLYAFLGCLLGTLIGVLPGLGPVATIAMLLPTTYALPPTAALMPRIKPQVARCRSRAERGRLRTGTRCVALTWRLRSAPPAKGSVAAAAPEGDVG